jgi:hypothetical protein
MSSTPVAYVEDHDADLEEIRLLADGGAEVVFAAVAVYRPAEPAAGEIEAFEVRLHSGVMRLRGVSAFDCRGAWERSNSLADGAVRGASGEVIPWLDLLTEKPIEVVELRFTTGGVASIEAAAAELRLEGAGRFLERWSGPLA